MFAGKHHHLELGQSGEKYAREYLEKNHYEIVQTNFRRPCGEIDIIAIDPDKTLVFVEVKTIALSNTANNQAILPEDNLTKSKLEKLKKVCSMFAGKHSELVDDDKGWRIDLLALTLRDKNFLIKHYENI